MLLLKLFGYISLDPKRKQIADEIIARMDLYCEISPSGDGYHIIGRCDLSRFPKNYNDDYFKNFRDAGLECYIGGITNRYFTVTEKSVGRMVIEENTDGLLWFINTYMRKENANKVPDAKPCGFFGQLRFLWEWLG